MKLRNKKTGEIGCLYCDHIGNPKKMTVFLDDNDLSAEHWDYSTLSELNEDWEDYKPKSPLIKDEKIRKAVRAWAEANKIETVEYNEYWVSFRRDDKTIGFKDEDSCLGFFGLENSKDYTITELCGEEEE